MSWALYAILFFMQQLQPTNYCQHKMLVNLPCVTFAELSNTKSGEVNLFHDTKCINWKQVSLTNIHLNSKQQHTRCWCWSMLSHSLTTFTPFLQLMRNIFLCFQLGSCLRQGYSLQTNATCDAYANHNVCGCVQKVWLSPNILLGLDARELGYWF